MVAKKNYLKLNKLQLRTLALLQLLAKDERAAQRDPETGETRILRLPHAHGDHVHVGKFVVSKKDASGLENPAVWVALERKGLIRVESGIVAVMTADALVYNTSSGDPFLTESDH